MAGESPFLLTRVECPICKTLNEFESVRLGAYTEEGRDTDFCPTGITWRNTRYQAHNPLAYFIATCDHCLYSRELTPEFKDWKNDRAFRSNRLKAIKERHLEQLARDESFLPYLGSAIDMARFPNESAIIKLLLAVFDEELTGDCSHLDIGRYYLRAGWVFRSLGSDRGLQLSPVQGMVYSLETAFRRVAGARQELHNGLTALDAEVATHFAADDMTAEMRSRLIPYRDRFSDSLVGLSRSLSQLSDDLAAVQSLLDEYRTAVSGSDIGSGNRPFRSGIGFNEFLQSARKKWPGVVTNEHEALTLATEYYGRAISQGRDLAPGNQRLQALYLMAELSRRIGRHEQAREFFNSTIRYGQDLISPNQDDQARTALARKILELAIEQGKTNKAALAVA